MSIKENEDRKRKETEINRKLDRKNDSLLGRRKKFSEVVSSGSKKVCVFTI